MIRKLLLFFTVLAIFSCGNMSETEKEIEKVEVDFEVIRFDEKFAEASPESLPELKAEYPYLFPKQYGDEVWEEKLTDTIQLELNAEVAKAFSDFSREEDELHRFFQHIKYYFPDFETPDVITITSEVDYKNKVVIAEDKLFIALDTYLGQDHHFYIGLQEYLKKNFWRSQILPDVSQAYAKKYVPRPQARTFLAHMIYYGKMLYLKDLWIPFRTDADKIGYTPEEFEWAKSNEEQIWRHFVDKEFIFDTDSELYTRFLYPAPFSKFYLALDNESPDRLGQYIGWQIIRKYMDRNEASVEEMLQTDAETIFNNANYKPSK
ncbi:MAG: gliding motility lipoprotein GldB [Salegentibacter sp.]|uniref:gliding motility lipoprotein GldB n=1 Tax=Salegentibacter sp. TaxID=1903072 RepID=UPI0028702CBD|nr:gliding motility lipoprotein GldB [Salegentibacter sp.]MDR9456453.1 gliding motility lipoprotein GldB [Salegentibacter sp.]